MRSVKSLKDDMKLSVVIPTHNNLESLKRCIESWRVIQDTDYELLIIEDGCTDGTADWLKSNTDGEQVRWFHEDDVYETLSDNRGMRESRGEYILIWQDDMYIQHPKAMSWPLGMLGHYPEISVLGLKRGVIVLPMTRLTGMADPTTDANFASFYPKYSHYTRFSSPIHFAELHGCVRPWIIQRRWLDEVGLLDEVFAPFNWDEIDLHLRIRSKGGRIMTIPCEQMRLYQHIGSLSTSRHNQDWYYGVILRNAAIVHKRWDSATRTLEVPLLRAMRTVNLKAVRENIIFFYLYFLSLIPRWIIRGFPAHW